MAGENGFKKWGKVDWIRDHVDIVIEERPAKLDDMVNESSFPDKELLMEDPNTWKSENTDYKARWLDPYLVRRTVTNTTAHVEVSQGSVTADVLGDWVDAAGSVSTPIIIVSGGTINFFPSTATTYLKKLSVTDQPGGKSLVRGTWKQFTEWEVVQVADLPST